jgi:hypothetical protein
MSNQEISQLIAQLLAAIAKHEQTETQKDNKLKIKGLDVTFEELQSSAKAQEMLISLHNDMHDAICNLESRVAELEEENN